jgi:hypothetical protein
MEPFSFEKSTKEVSDSFKQYCVSCMTAIDHGSVAKEQQFVPSGIEKFASDGRWSIGIIERGEQKCHFAFSFFLRACVFNQDHFLEKNYRYPVRTTVLLAEFTFDERLTDMPRSVVIDLESSTASLNLDSFT